MWEILNVNIWNQENREKKLEIENCENTQLWKYTIMKILNCENTQLWKYTIVKMQNFENQILLTCKTVQFVFVKNKMVKIKKISKK